MMVYFITWLLKILYSEPWPYFPYLDWCPDVVYLAGSSMRKLKPKWRTLTSKIEGRQQFSYHFSHLTVSLNKLSVHKITIFLLNWCQNMKKTPNRMRLAQNVGFRWAGLDRADKNVKKDWHCTSISALFGFTFWTQVKLQTIENSLKCFQSILNLKWQPQTNFRFLLITGSQLVSQHLWRNTHILNNLRWIFPIRGRYSQFLYNTIQ